MSTWLHRHAKIKAAGTLIRMSKAGQDNIVEVVAEGREVFAHAVCLYCLDEPI